jgi:hypothetical protein
MPVSPRRSIEALQYAGPDSPDWLTQGKEWTVNRPTVLIVILVADLLLLLIGIFGSLWFGADQLRMLSFTTAAIGIWTFLGFFYVLYGPGLVIEMAMRNAITASVISMFLVTVGIVTFFSTIPTAAGTAPPPLSELTRTIVSSFQSVVTVVIGFYFTSSAIVEGIQRNKTGSIRDQDAGPNAGKP